MKKLFTTIAAMCVCVAAAAQPQMSHAEANAKADEMLARLTLDEKISMTRGLNKFFITGVPAKGLPHVFTSDASVGVRINNGLPDKSMQISPKKTTRFPASIALASTFDPALSYEYAKALGEECRMAGIDILLGPGLNIYRSSQCGRNFEYLGEDPYLVSRMVESYVEGMQSTGTMACLKHFLCNNTEFYRKRSNSVVGERAIMEIYTPGFKAGIDAGAGSVMTSYNLVNGEWAGQSKYVITDLLRGTLGFKDLVMSDWESVYDWKKIVLSGQNIEMPGKDYFYMSHDVKALVEAGELTEKNIDDMIRPTIATCIRFGFYERINSGNKYCWEMESLMPDHEKVAYRTAAEGTVLLENNGILPYRDNGEGEVLLTGRWANEVPRGGGSSRVKGYNLVPFTKSFGKVFGERLKYVERPTAEQLKAAALVICATGVYSTENAEQEFAFDKEEESLVRLVVESNPRNIVIVNSGTASDMSAWNKKAGALLMGWFPGQNGCQAITDIVMGKVNPSGKLPMTIERSFADSPAANTVPKGASIKKAKGNPNEYFFSVYDVNYDEGVLVGYRWYEKRGIEPLYPFGHGLSYTSFEVGNHKILKKGKVKSIATGESVKVSVTVTNTGTVEGTEVVQLYVGENNPTVIRPVKELKGFRRVTLAPGEKQVVVFELKHSDLAFWDEQAHAWKANAGDYTVFVGTSSADIRAQLTVKAL